MTAVSPDRLLGALLAVAVVLLVVGWFGFRWGLDLEVARGFLVVALTVVVLAGAGVLAEVVEFVAFFRREGLR